MKKIKEITTQSPPTLKEPKTIWIVFLAWPFEVLEVRGIPVKISGDNNCFPSRFMPVFETCREDAVKWTMETQNISREEAESFVIEGVDVGKGAFQKS